MINIYAKAYTEILEILKYLPKDEYSKIPKSKIEFYEKNKDSNYIYNYNSTKPLNEQQMLRETNVLIILLFRDFWATDFQREKLNNILNTNEQKAQECLREKYSPDNIFKNKTNNIMNKETSLVESSKEKWYKKLFHFFREILKK